MKQDVLLAREAPPPAEQQIATQLDGQRRMAAVIDVLCEAMDELARESFTMRRWQVPGSPRWYHRWVVRLADRWAPVIAGEQMQRIAEAAMNETSAMSSQDWRELKRVTPVRAPTSPYQRQRGKIGPRGF